MTDRRASTAPATAAPAAPAARRPKGLHVGPVPVSLVAVVVGLALLGSAAYIVWVVFNVEDRQLDLLAYGFVVLGASFAAIAVGCVRGIWRAASRASGGRALALAIVGGLAGLAAIGCFTMSVLSALVSGS